MSMKGILIHIVTALAEMNLIYYGLHFFGVVTISGLSVYVGTIALAVALGVLATYLILKK